MKHEYFMTADDWLELAAIEAAVEDVRQRRAKLMTRLRQRAYLAKRREAKP